MFGVDNYAAVRRFVFAEGHGRRAAARVFGLSRETVLKMCRFLLPPSCARTALVAKLKLAALLPVIDADRKGPVKQRHAAKRIFERLRDFTRCCVGRRLPPINQKPAPFDAPKSYRWLVLQSLLRGRVQVWANQFLAASASTDS